MKAMILALTFLAGMASAHAEVSDILGRYVSQTLDGNNGKASAEIKLNDQGQPIMIFDVACGSKIIPRTLAMQTAFGTTGTLNVIDYGSSQCDLPEGARFFVLRNKLTIYTNIRVPGFSGKYEFVRE